MDHFATKSMVEYNKNIPSLTLKKVGKNLKLFEAHSTGKYHYQDNNHLFLLACQIIGS